jgi:predicted phosphohydrolase
MAKFAWATDIHLDHCDEKKLIAFGESLIASNPEAIILSGDISNGRQITFHLSALEKIVERPIYFVLGNHDYYGSSIEETRKTMKEVSNYSQYLRYLPNQPYAVMSPSTALIGHDGWYDALNGDWKLPGFNIADWRYIAEFAAVSQGGVNKANIVDVAKKLAHDGVMHVHNAIKSATRYHQNIVIVTHVPPFAESHLYKGKVGDADAQPWFTSKMMGDMLLDAAKSFPKVSFTVFAGHTHGKYSGKFSDNLTVHVGGWPLGQRDYGNPILQEVIEIP